MAQKQKTKERVRELPPIKVRRAQTFKFWGTDIPTWKDCPECGSKLSCKFGSYAHAPRCNKCQRKKDELESKNRPKDNGFNFFVNTHREVTAFGYDTHTGQPVWLDKKGKKVRADDPGIRYNLKNDKHGWKATGKKVAPFDDRGRPNI